MKTITLTEAQALRLENSLEACLAVARAYRRDIADENSILLLQRLVEIDSLLGTGQARPEDHQA